MSEHKEQPTTQDSHGVWDLYDRILERNQQEIEALKSEHYKKNWLARLLGRRSLREKTSQLRLEVTKVFTDTLIKIDPSLQVHKDRMDIIREVYHK